MKKDIRSAQVLLALMTVLGLVGCLRFGLTYFDPTTYQNLTEIKPRIDLLYLSFSTDKIDTTEIQSIRLKISQMYEYERGKGPNNAPTAKQIDLIRGMFDRHSNSRLHNGQWSNEMLQNNRENIMKLFDTAIETEWLKNKNR